MHRDHQHGQMELDEICRVSYQSTTFSIRRDLKIQMSVQGIEIL